MVRESENAGASSFDSLLRLARPSLRSNQALAPNSPDAFIHLNDAVQADRRPGLSSKAVADLLWGPLKKVKRPEYKVDEKEAAVSGGITGSRNTETQGRSRKTG